MAFNVRSGGKAESVPVASTILSGDLVRVGAMTGIAETDAVEGADGLFYTTLALEGIAHHSISGAVAVGARLYTNGADGAKGTLTTTSASGATLVGYATRVKGTGVGEVWFKLVPSAAVAATA